MSESQPTMSTDPRALYTRALSLARSPNETDVAELRRLFGDDRYLSSLDSMQAYAGPAERLRVAGVLQTLAANTSLAARRAIASLTTDSVFLAARARKVLLIQALAVVHPPDPTTIKFWDSHCEPEDGYSNYTIRAVIENGTPEALAIFEKNLRDLRHEDDREGWLLFDVLTHRNDVALLESSERLISGPLDEHIRRRLVDVLFDYDEDWYGPHDIPKPPPRELATKEALLQLERIGRKALEIRGLTATQSKRVSAVLSEIQSRLERR